MKHEKNIFLKKGRSLSVTYHCLQTVIYECFETAIILPCETWKIFFWKKINGRSVSVIYDCFQTVINGRFKTANIWLNKTGCVLLEAYMGVPKQLYMSVSPLQYVDVPKHLHSFVLECLSCSELPSLNCF